MTKLNTSSTALVYSTYLGGNNADFGKGIAVDSAGNAYVTGQTSSTDFPTTLGAFEKRITVIQLKLRGMDSTLPHLTDSRETLIGLLMDAHFPWLRSFFGCLLSTSGDTTSTSRCQQGLLVAAKALPKAK